MISIRPSRSDDPTPIWPRSDDLIWRSRSDDPTPVSWHATTATRKFLRSLSPLVSHLLISQIRKNGTSYIFLRSERVGARRPGDFSDVLLLDVGDFLLAATILLAATFFKIFSKALWCRPNLTFYELAISASFLQNSFLGELPCSRQIKAFPA